MKLVEVQVDNYNLLCDLHLGGEDFSGRVTLVRGPNEAGKSTLMGFIRAILFGFTRRGELAATPLKGGHPGGELVFDAGGGKLYRVRRTAPPRRGKVLVTGSGGTQGDEVLLRGKVLHGVSYLVFKNIFAFGLDELRRLEDLKSEEVSAHIYGAGAGVPAGRLASAAKALQDRMDQLFRPGGQRQEINRVLKELGEQEAVIRQLQRLPDKYIDLRREVENLEGRRTGLEEEQRNLERRVRRLEQLQQARAPWVDLMAARHRLEEIPAVEAFPVAGLERLESLLEKQYSAWSGLAALGDKPGLEESDLTGRKQVLDGLEQDLGQLAPVTQRLEQCRFREADLTRALDGLRAELEEQAAGLHPGLPAAVAALFGLLGAGVFGQTGDTVLTALVFALGALAAWLAAGQGGRLRQDQAARQRRRQGDAEKTDAALSELQLEMAGLAAEEQLLQARVASAAQSIFGRGAVTMAEVMAARRDLAAARQTLSQRDALEKAAFMVEQELADLLAAGGAGDAEEFRRRAAWHQEALDLAAEIRQCQRQLDLLAGSPRLRPGLEKELAALGPGDIDLELAAKSSRLAEIALTLNEIMESTGRLKEQVEALESGEELDAALQKRELARAELANLAREWQARALCLQLLQLAREKHERERQPAVLRRASAYLGPMTGVAYHRVVWDKDRLGVVRPGGAYVDAADLSRGAAAQLYLAVRFALACQYGEIVRLPIILDDILVDFDPHRLRGALQVIEEISREHQVIMFTCHQHIVDACREILPDLSLVHLDMFTRGRVMANH